MSMTQTDIKNFLEFFSISASEYNALIQSQKVVSVDTLRLYGEDVIQYIEKNLIHDAIDKFIQNNDHANVTRRVKRPDHTELFQVKLFTFTEETFYMFLKDYTESLLQNKRDSRLLKITLGDIYSFENRKGMRSWWNLRAVDDIGVRIRNTQTKIECTIPKLYFMNNFQKEHDTNYHEDTE